MSDRILTALVIMDDAPFEYLPPRPPRLSLLLLLSGREDSYGGLVTFEETFAGLRLLPFGVDSLDGVSRCFKYCGMELRGYSR